MSSFSASSLRGLSESAEVDLGSASSAAAVDAVVAAAFGEAVALDAMIRITLVVGAGKGGRQKYHESLQKWVVASLKALNYTDDRSASCDWASCGSFKVQHDTGRNLFFVHVFPRATQAAGAAVGGAAPLGAAAAAAALSHEALLVASEAATFQRAVQRNCGLWSQKKRLADDLRATRTRLANISAKLMDRQALADDEQALYDLGSVDDLDAKVAWVVLEAKKMLDACLLTAKERDQALEQMADRLDAAAEGKAKQQLEQRLAALKADRGRKTAFELDAPRHDAAIRDLHKQLAALEPVEAQSKGGKLLSLDQAKALATKPELEERIEALHEGCRGWYETDAELADRLKPLVQHLKAARAKALNAPTAKAGNSMDGWSTMSSANATSKARGPSKSKPTAGRGNGFGMLSD
mmetsp:Transcript_28153/g.100037  ORF Transcript_28153/g.100037 Transcript_28153/m.100037 type:complete len:410 (-) Transcript_28153:200-1429(-)